LIPAIHGRGFVREVQVGRSSVDSNQCLPVRLTHVSVSAGQPHWFESSHFLPLLMGPRLWQFLTLIQISHFSPSSSLGLALDLDVTPADGPFRPKVKFMPANSSYTYNVILDCGSRIPHDLLVNYLYYF
jgi:hypothetical protein